MEKYIAIVYLVTFFLLFPFCLLIFLKSNIHQIFKKGEVFAIRVFYVFLALGLDFLVTSSICAIMSAIAIIFNL
jgi:hypothetical protein